MRKKKDPQINLNDKIVSFDCDDTLVMWGDNYDRPGKGRIEIPDPYMKNPDGTPHMLYLTPHTKHIQKIKGYARSGYFVIIWSMGGGEWARNVAEALKLTEHVDLITGKPLYLYDDMPLNKAFGEHRYFKTKKVKEE
jgi:hypothetical protein